MKINEIIIDNLYGNDYSIMFNKDLTILYGVNGSGKTTILEIIYQITSGNIQNIFRYKFDKIIVKFELEILSIISNMNFYEVEFKNEKIRIERKNEESTIEKQYYLSESFINQDVEFNGSERVSYSKKLVNLNKQFKDKFELTFIPLNREIRGIDERRYRYNPLIRKQEKNIMAKGSNFNRTLYLANQYYKNYEETILREESAIQSQLEKNIIERLAEPIEDIQINKPLKEKTDIEEMKNYLITRTSGKVKDNLEKLINIYVKSSREISNKLDEYDSKNDGYKAKPNHILELVNETVKQRMSYFQVEKIYEVALLNSKKRKRIERKKLKLKKTLEHINKLLIDTNKKVIFNGRKGLVFKNLKTNEDLPLEYLSSGEIQLVIFMVFSLVKNQDYGDNKILLIDEPELSMHISWQEQLLPLMTEYIDNGQMIIATHSPDVIGQMRNKCIEVRAK